MGKFGIFFGHFEYITAMWPFGNFVAILYISTRFGILCGEKSGNPGRDCNGRHMDKLIVYN
jgi:hypothetical protein